MHMKVYDESIQLGEAGGKGQGLQDGGQRGQRCGQEPLGKGVNGNENELGSAHHPKGVPFRILTGTPYRLNSPPGHRSRGQEDRRPESWFGW